MPPIRPPEPDRTPAGYLWCLVHISQKGPSRAVPGLLLDVFWPYRTGPGGTTTGCLPFFHPRVTFNSNLKVTRAPARKIPRPPAWTKTRRIPAQAPYGTRAGACGVLTWFVGDPGGVPPVPLRCPSGSRTQPLSGPLYNLQWDTQLLRDELINVRSINPSINKSINQFRLFLILQTVFVTWINLHRKMYTNNLVFKLSLHLWIGLLRTINFI